MAELLEILEVMVELFTALLAVLLAVLLTLIPAVILTEHLLPLILKVFFEIKAVDQSPP